MTIHEDKITLWDNGQDRFCMVSVPSEEQYPYISGSPCMTIGFVYENERYRGYDAFCSLTACM